jgi:aminoglycoside phosphotransferase (APT) family kinase protein
VVATLDIEDPAAVVAYLRAEGRIGGDEDPVVSVLAGGVSCRTVRIDRPGGDSWVLKQALARLRVEVEWLSDPSRIHREALGMQWLAELLPAGSVPAFVFEDEALHLVAMTAVEDPHEQWKRLLLAGEVDRGLVGRFGSMLASIHGGAAVRAQLREVFADRSFFETLRLEPYYLYSAQREPEAEGFLGDLVAETRRTSQSLVHGDYSPKNILVARGRLVLLDHEVIHWGDPAFDVGFATAHLLAKALHVPRRRAEFLRAVALFWDSYGVSLAGTFAAEPPYEARAVRHAVGCLLARAVGRSTLEYLTGAERARQKGAALALTRRPPATFRALIARYGDLLDASHR